MTRTVQYQTKKVKLEPFQEAYEADCNECLNLKQKIEELGQLSKQLAKLTTTAENDRLGTLLLKINKMKHQKTSIKDGTLLEGTGTIEMLILNDPVAKKSDSDFASTALAIALSGPDPALKMGTSSTSMISRSTNQKALFIEQVLQLITDEQNIMQDLYKKINGPLDDYPVEDILSLSKRHGQKQLRESVTTSSPTAETNRVEDLPSLTDIWKTFIKTSKGKKPSCLQRLSKCDGLNKILIDTTDEDNPELKTFLAKTNYENHKSYFLIHVVRPSAPFRYAGKGQANHIVRSHITLGGPIFSAHAAKRVPDTFDSIFKPQVADNIGNDSVWSLGLLVKDVDTEAVYLATCAHGAWKSLEQPIPLKFYSAISRCHEVNFPISCTDYHAHYGRLDEKEDVSPLIDMLLLQLPNSFLNSKDVNLVLSKDDKPMDMSIYSGNMKEFLNAEVYMHGSVSGFRKGRLIDAIDENNILMLSKLEFETWGGFMVVSDESCEASSGQNFANYGDSAALVYTKHPQVADTWLALGQVWGEAARNHIANSGVSYEHVTYCTSLKYAQQYARKTFGINMTYHAHSKIVNHVQEIGHLEIAMQDAVNGALRLGRRARVAPVR